MSDTHNPAIIEDFVSEPRSRMQFLKGAAVTAAALGLAPAVAGASPLAKLAGRSAGMVETPQEIFNIAATAEAAAVTALYHVHLAVNRNQLNVSGVAVPVNSLVSIVRAALREEQDHLAFIMGAGGRPLYHKFNFPEGIFTTATTTLSFFETAETIFIAAYMAATREFASGGHGRLAQYTYQIGGTEAEHRTLMRVGLGQLPPNNKSFETNRFGRVEGAAKELQGLGIFKPRIPYPGARAVNHILATSGDHKMQAGVVQRKP